MRGLRLWPAEASAVGLTRIGASSGSPACLSLPVPRGGQPWALGHSGPPRIKPRRFYYSIPPDRGWVTHTPQVVRRPPAPAYCSRLVTGRRDVHSAAGGGTHTPVGYRGPAVHMVSTVATAQQKHGSRARACVCACPTDPAPGTIRKIAGRSYGAKPLDRTSYLQCNR